MVLPKRVMQASQVFDQGLDSFTLDLQMMHTEDLLCTWRWQSLLLTCHSPTLHPTWEHFCQHAKLLTLLPSNELGDNELEMDSRIARYFPIKFRVNQHKPTQSLGIYTGMLCLIHPF